MLEQAVRNGLREIPVDHRRHGQRAIPRFAARWEEQTDGHQDGEDG